MRLSDRQRDASQGSFVLNIKGGLKMPNITYELKYCERCGSLGLRRSQSGETYCKPCGQMLNNYAIPADAGRRSRLRQPKLPVAVPGTVGVDSQSASPCGRLQ